MKEHEQVDALNWCLKEAKALKNENPSSERFQNWHDDTRYTLQRLFPHEKAFVQAFLKVRFEPEGFNQAGMQGAVFREGLQQSSEILYFAAEHLGLQDKVIQPQKEKLPQQYLWYILIASLLLYGIVGMMYG